MAVLWVWAGGDESSADPMISNLVGDKKTNETMDVFLVKALLNILYGWNPLKDGPPLPVPGTAWDDAAVAYVADYQSRIMKRKKVDAVVSPVPVGISYHTAWVKKYTIATMVGGSRSVLSVKGESDLVTYLKSNYPALKASFRTVRNGSIWTETGGTSEEVHPGGNPEGEVSTPQFTRP
jgi:hypothetical protein